MLVVEMLLAAAAVGDGDVICSADSVSQRDLL